MKSSYISKMHLNERCGDYLSSYLFSEEHYTDGSNSYIPPRLPAAPTEKNLRGSFPANVFGTANTSSESAFRKIFKIF